MVRYDGGTVQWWYGTVSWVRRRGGVVSCQFFQRVTAPNRQACLDERNDGESMIAWKQEPKACWLALWDSRFGRGQVSDSFWPVPICVKSTDVPS